MTRTGHTTDTDGAAQAAVTIFPQAVFDDLDALTHRRAHGDLSDKDASVRDTASSDSRDPFDRGVLVRHAEFRDAQARRRLRAFLSDPAPDAGVWDDWMSLTEEGASMPLRYLLNASPGSNVLRTLSAYLHRFLVRGIMRDWCLDAGIATSITEEELEGLLDEAADILTPSYAPTPLHPFDPKY